MLPSHQSLSLPLCVVAQGLMGPPSQRSAPALSEETLSINEADFPVPPPIPRSAPMVVPPEASPMPARPAAPLPGFPITPATGGKGPATATGGYLQVGDWRAALVCMRWLLLLMVCPLIDKT